MAEKPNTTKPGVVEKIIKPIDPEQPEKAQIVVEGADHLYREIRIENTLVDEKGKEVKLKEGAEVDVIVEADSKDTVPKKNAKKDSPSVANTGS
jgi:predicted DNA-binding antitoxin AbrB/MazE fold protein